MDLTYLYGFRGKQGLKVLEKVDQEMPLDANCDLNNLDANFFPTSQDLSKTLAVICEQFILLLLESEMHAELRPICVDFFW